VSELFALSEEGWLGEPVWTARPLILIVGMHRSGTSLLTGSLRRLGLIMGWRLNNEGSVFFHRVNLDIEQVTLGTSSSVEGR